MNQPPPASTAPRGSGPPSKHLTGLVLVALFVLGLALVDRRQVHPDARRGAAAPPLVLPTVAGAPFDLEGRRGAPVVINFWATWCGPCRLELPELARAARELEGCGVPVVGVASDSPRAEVTSATTEICYPVALDERGEAARDWGVENFPTTFVVDRDGVIAAVIEGALTRPELLEAVRPLLETPCAR